MLFNCKHIPFDPKVAMVIPHSKKSVCHNRREHYTF